MARNGDDRHAPAVILDVFRTYSVPCDGRTRRFSLRTPCPACATCRPRRGAACMYSNRGWSYSPSTRRRTPTSVSRIRRRRWRPAAACRPPGRDCPLADHCWLAAAGCWYHFAFAGFGVHGQVLDSVDRPADRRRARRSARAQLRSAQRRRVSRVDRIKPPERSASTRLDIAVRRCASRVPSMRCHRVSIRSASRSTPSMPTPANPSTRSLDRHAPRDQPRRRPRTSPRARRADASA